MARLYANENFPLQVVFALRQFGHDVLTIQETGKGGEAVPELEAQRFALANDRTVITSNRRDFIRQQNIATAHHWIIVCSVDSSVLTLAHRIHDAITSNATLKGVFLRGNRI